MYAACYIVYNNEKTIGQSLESVLPHVEKVVIVDGAFETYPHKVPWSTDNTKGIAEKLCGSKLIWVGCEKPWTQIEKRNQYLKHIPNGEHFIITDSDDVLKGDVETDFKQIEQKLCVGVRCVKFYPKWRGSYLDIPEEAWPNLEWTQAGGLSCRIYLKRENMEYRHHHSTIYVGNQVISRSQRNLKNVFLYSLHIKTWREYMADIIYRVERPSSKTGRRYHILERYTGGIEPGNQLIQMKKILGFKHSQKIKKPKRAQWRRLQKLEFQPKTLLSEQKTRKKMIKPVKISAIQKWSHLMEINRSLGKPWNTGFPYIWHKGMRASRFLMELPEHLETETRWR